MVRPGFLEWLERLGLEALAIDGIFVLADFQPYLEDPLVVRRLREELGVGSALRRVFSFSYTAEDPDSGFTEREFDHVFVGVLREQPRPDPAEIDGLRWIRGADLVRDVAAHPEHYTPWFSELLERLPELEAALPATPA